MKKAARILGWSCAAGLSLFLFLGLSAYLFRHDIKKGVVEKLNTVLKAPVSVGEITFNIFENFPDVTVSFNKTVFTEAYQNSKENLASAEKISVTLNLWDAVQKKIDIKSIILHKADITARIDKSGNANFEIFTSGEGEDQGTQKDLRFQKIKISESRFSFENEKTGICFSSEIKDLALSGAFHTGVFEMAAKAELSCSFQSGRTHYLKGRKIAFNTELTVDKTGNVLHFDNSRFKLDELAFTAAGNLAMNNSGNTDINIKGEKLEVIQLLSLLPETYRLKTEQYKGAGNISFNAVLKQAEKEDPSINAEFSIRKGALHLQEIDEGLKDINLDGRLFVNGKTQELTLDQFSLRLMNEQVKGKLRLNDFNDPYLDGLLLGEVDAANLNRVIKLNPSDTLRGLLQFDISVKSRLSYLLKKQNLEKAFFDGKLKGQGVTFVSEEKGQNFRNIGFNIRINPKTAVVESLQGEWQGSDFDISGKADNLLQYLLKDEKLFISGKLKGKSWKFDPPKQKNPGKKDNAEFDFPEKLVLDVQLDLQHFELGKFSSEDISGKLRLSDRVLLLEDLALSTCQGKLKMNGRWSKTSEKEHKIVARAAIRQINISQLFYAFNNFSQQSLTDKHLNGTVSADVDVAMMMDRSFQFKPEKLYVFSSLQIEKGQLLNYDPLLSLSRFVKVKELENVRFETIENEIEIRDEKIFIPKMEIRNNALDLFLEGTHAFSGFLEYHVQLKLRDVLAKNRVDDTEDVFYEADNDAVNLFLLMKGAPPSIKISYDNKKAGQSFKKQMKEEKKTIKNLVIEEFGIETKDKSGKERKEKVTTWEDDIPQ